MPDISISLRVRSRSLLRFRNNIVPFFLERFPGASIAYSLRQLHPDAVLAIRVRRSSDDQEMDIGFTSTGVLDESALLLFVGSGDGFVVIWYDQSGNNNHASQSVASAQPLIVNNAGTVIKENGKPAIKIPTQSEHLVALNISNAIQSVFGVYEFDVLPSQLASGSWVWNHLLNNFDRLGGFGNPNNDNLLPVQRGNANFTDLSGGVAITTQENLLITDILDDTNTLKSFKNNSEFTSISAYSPTHGGGDLFIGEYDGRGTIGMVGTFSELIFYPSDQSANRAEIEGDINSYYSIY